MDNRVIFYSKSDLSNWSNLELAEQILNKTKLDDEFSILDYIEFYNINLFFENWVFLKRWTEEEKQKYKSLANKLNKLSIEYTWKIWDDELNEWIKVLNNESLYGFEYKNKLIEMIYKFWAYKNISWSCILNILNNDPAYIYPVLKNKSLSKYFWKEIRTFLLWYKMSWELLLDKKSWKVDYFFPECLTNEDKERIIDNYLTQNNNIYYESAEIANLRDDKFLRIDNKIKLKAKNIHERIWKDTISEWTKINFSVNVEFQENCKSPRRYVVKNQWNEIEQRFTCSKILLENIKYELDPLGVFICIFKYLNPQWLINFLYKSCKSWTFEKIIFEIWKDWYQTNFEFMIDEQLGFLSMIAFNTKILTKQNKSIEWLINRWIEILSNKIKWLKLRIDEKDDTYENKIIKMAPKFDLLIKQFRSFLEYWNVDIEYANKLSYIPFDQIPSKIDRKYLYVNDWVLKNAAFLLFSDQSNLAYIPKITEKFENLFFYVTKVNFSISDLEDYQIIWMKYLIDEWFLYEDENKNLKIKDSDLIYILLNIYVDWELYYNHYNEPQKKIIQKYIDNWELTVWKTLLSNKESDYYDYYLNDHKFSNWLKIRNKNLHGYVYKDEDEAKKDYYILLQLFILLIIKIDQELSWY